MMDDPIAFKAYFALFEEAQMYQNQDQFEKAADIHRKIFQKYVPAGIAYYEWAASCFLILGQYNDAERIYNIALSNPHAFNETTWRYISSKFPVAIKQVEVYKIAYREVFSTIESTPGVLQKELKNLLQDIPADVIELMIQWMLRKKAIRKSKQGRFVTLYPNDRPDIV
ncbi:hypothetical protein [Paenibacillus dendritiformis]|uniref:hypothetical protein n=1 Tax=Paenibacillus dendritiformis TaxID=130049 RepID=UPI000DAA652A|nr:hypothetical protein [Paenibacillus dendritiformis]PZM63426.1 hypothetical protein DOE73_21940 [Paenibacillus dendritiformis]